LRAPYPFAFLSAFLLLFPLVRAPLEGRDKPKPEDYALIFGTVWGPDDRPVSGIEVKIRRATEKKPRWRVYSNRRGEFEQRVPVGKADYLISAETKGFKLPGGKRLQPSPEITVHIESNERADTGLHLK
jgi:hypothetical protein